MKSNNVQMLSKVEATENSAVNLNLQPQPSQPSTSNLNLIIGGKHEDTRGAMRFVNDFDMSEVKRFYTIANSAASPKRGWILHHRETKWFFPLRGTTTIYVESVGRVCPHTAENKNENSAVNLNLQPQPYILDASNPQILCVPPHHWFLIEQDGTAEVQVFSNCRVNEFPNDDFRRPIGNEKGFSSKINAGCSILT